MPCKLDRPSPQDLYNRIRDNFSANVLGGFEIIPETNEAYVVSNDYAMYEELLSVIEQQYSARDERYACCDDLYAMAAKRGVFPAPAGFAQGYVKITGDAGATLPIPLDVRIGGQNYRATGTVPAVLPETGEIAVRVQAIIPGVDGNEPAAGTVGQLTSLATGIDSDVELYGRFCGGTEAEECEAFRERYIDRLAYAPRSTMAWLLEKIKDWPCVTRVAHRSGSCCEVTGEPGTSCGCNACVNSLEFYPLFDATFDCGIPPACVIEDMNVWLFGDPPGRGLGQVEIGVCGKLYAPVATSINVRLAGLSCATPTQIEQIRERIKQLFARAVPSELFTVRSVEVLVTQVIGASEDFTVTFEVVNGEMSMTPCGDLNPACDVLPCLNDVIFANAYAPQNLC